MTARPFSIQRTTSFGSLPGKRLDSDAQPIASREQVTLDGFSG